MKRFWAVLVIFLAACTGEEIIPTNAPVIPVASPTPSPEQLGVTLDPRTPTPDVSGPTWTPQATETLRPTRTLAPTSTPAPTRTLESAPSSGLQDLGEGRLQLNLSETVINIALEAVEAKPRLDAELNSLWASFGLTNAFLEQDSTIRARLLPLVERDVLKLRLIDYEVDGPSVSRGQVESVIAAIETQLSEMAFAEFGTPTRLTAARTLTGLIQIDAETE